MEDKLLKDEDRIVMRIVLSLLELHWGRTIRPSCTVNFRRSEEGQGEFHATKPHLEKKSVGDLKNEALPPFDSSKGLKNVHIVQQHGLVFKKRNGLRMD